MCMFEKITHLLPKICVQKRYLLVYIIQEVISKITYKFMMLRILKVRLHLP